MHASEVRHDMLVCVRGQYLGRIAYARRNGVDELVYEDPPGSGRTMVVVRSNPPDGGGGQQAEPLGEVERYET